MSMPAEHAERLYSPLLTTGATMVVAVAIMPSAMRTALAQLDFMPADSQRLAIDLGLVAAWVATQLVAVAVLVHVAQTAGRRGRPALGASAARCSSVVASLVLLAVGIWTSADLLRAWPELLETPRLLGDAVWQRAMLLAVMSAALGVAELALGYAIQPRCDDRPAARGRSAYGGAP